MKRIYLLPIFLFGFLASCSEENQKQDQAALPSVNATVEMQVPASFAFATERTVQLQVNLDQAPFNGVYRLDLYDSRPGNPKGKIGSYLLNSENQFNAELQVATAVDQLYLVLRSPDGSSSTSVEAIAGNRIDKVYFPAKRGKGQVVVSSPDCNSGCDQSPNLTNNTLNLNSNQVYCLSGNYNGGGINAGNGAVIRLCGTGFLQNVNLNNGAQLLIIDGAEVRIQNLNINNSTSLTVYDGAELELSNTFSPNGNVSNWGEMEIQALNLNAPVTFDNYGDVNLGTSSNSSVNQDLNNYGSFTAGANLTINGGATVLNQCSFEVKGDLQLNGTNENYGFFEVEGRTTINGGAFFNLYDGAMALTEDLQLYGTIAGFGQVSLYKVEELSQANWGAQVTGNLEFCDLDGIENFPGGANIIRNGAVEGCGLYIPASSCNPAGNGAPVIVDADNDGVSDALDDYPNDPNLATEAFYPSDNSQATLAFEDLWPAYGDYDFNDLVVAYRYRYRLNANNQVVDMRGEFETRAIGGSFENGFGIQLDLPSSAVSNVSGSNLQEGLIAVNGNGCESGQNLATVIVFDNAYNLMSPSSGSFVNTVVGNPYVQPVTTTITIDFNSPVDLASLGTAPHNPFIFIDGNRGREVHLAVGLPTDLADASLFGTGEDDTKGDLSKTYRSVDNLPWAIHLPSLFAYPEEKQDVVQVYNIFSTWAQSGGTQAEDWYLDNPGNINSNLLYE